MVHLLINLRNKSTSYLSPTRFGGFFLLGTVLQLQQSELWAVHFYIGMVLFAIILVLVLILALVFILWSIKNKNLFIIVGLIFSLLGFGLTGWRSAVYSENTLNPALEGQNIWVRGIVASLPQRNETGVRFRLELESASENLPPLLDIAWYDPNPPTLQAGERWAMLIRVKAPHGARNPHGFDYELWLWEQGVQATGYIRAGSKDPAPQRLEQTWRYPIALARQTVRDRIYRQLSGSSKAQQPFAGLIAALVLGDQSAIDRADWNVFRATGVAHLVSISGLHITMFAWFSVGVVGWLWRRSSALCLAIPATNAALMGGVVLATAYALFSGWGVPAQRTCIMLATVIFLRLMGLRWPWVQVWMLACVAVVLRDPWALLQPGFWLSFVAVGVLFATDNATNLGATPAYSISDSGINRISRINSIKSHIRANLREQWVITVALTPLTLILFGQVSLVGLLANALAVPWITFLVTPLAMLGVLIPPLWEVAAYASAGFMAYLQWLASFSWAAWTVAIPPWWLGAAGVLGGVVIVLPWSWTMRVCGIPLLLPVLMWQAPLPPEGEFEILAPDIGQGNAVLLRTAHHALLYDTGPRYSVDNDAGHRVVVPLLQALNVRLDRVIVSHRDRDHVGGAGAVFAMQPQATLLTSAMPDALPANAPTLEPCQAGQHWEWDGVQFEILHPEAADYENQLKSNALSCVLRISNGKKTALLTGDIEKDQEAHLLQTNAARLKADVLLIPHHGSKTSSTPEFLDAVAPRWGIIQAGYRNRYGHPAPLVSERLRQRAITVLDSPHCGAVIWQSWLADGVVCWRIQNQRYWHHRV
ncbi:MAG: hypothetical protein RIR79_118 [Pseudomonadota bacterium]|jgi:competence protein ComEC